MEIDRSGGVRFKQVTDQRGGFRVRLLGFATANIPVPKWGRHGQDALLETTVKSLLRLLAEIADEIGGDHGLNVGRQATAAGIEVQALVDEVDFDSAIDQFAEVSPVLEIARRAVNLVDNDAARLAAF